ncbi:uncharacterized protein Z518_04088 [Rhinocladiella mackenziei CBS 650.93]|uniref:Heterokaryon incompatibility domain-containing protein n=1 Tax=Rhinocladiella mackenziei CBS 650.93 TaxID=1442369 RepID=A0A0D2IK90_9EURO|nr:uncharacterized protein Z518_04088 [Rhinocladiella mackenziei CBS 650.93]KIX06114.1 hypothetical protein Z518_04088 [Rhinocladiella mackenziei CBS 650.93]
MRLLKSENRGEPSLTKDLIEDIPSYAILSHTWGADEEEVTFNDVKDRSSKSKAGYVKIQFCEEQARRDGLQYFWVDTCCIDKANHTELSEAITSMFRWYRDAVKCYVYLSDVSARKRDNNQTKRTWESAFRKSRWFTRGWTLQELLAPKSVEFFSREGERLGNKNTLERLIHETTQIPVVALHGTPLSNFSVDERMRWTVNRNTKRKEDKAYCLMGIFDVSMPLLYGEGEKAFLRLKDEIDRSSKAKPRPSPPPSVIIPFRRDRDFVEREVLNDIWQRAFEPAARIGLVGLGGIGKTQLAIEHAYRVREDDPKTWVFWVHASSAARFEESYKKIAERVQLARWDEPKADVLGMVHGWLSDENNGRWTMVVDNADSRNVMFEPLDGRTMTQKAPLLSSALSSSSTDHSLSDYLPSSANGSIVITSRTREVVEGLIEYAEDIFDVGPMDAEAAVTLLRKKLKKYSGGIAQDDSVHLVRQLDYIPLAITQAAAYINQRAPRVTLSTYVETLEKSDADRVKLLQMDIRDPRRDRWASSSIIATWHISFEHLRQARDSAARLLALMSLFDREGIPDHLLRERYIENQDGENDFEEDIATLRAYHLVGMGVSDNLFDMHRLVQFSTKKWLELHGELGRWQERCVDILSEAFPTGDYANWRTCQALFPHVQAMATYRVDRPDSVKVWATVLYRGAWYASESGRYRVAERMAQASLEVREEVLGLDHIQTLDSVNNLAVALRDQGKYEEAESMNRRALVGREKVLGVEHPDTLWSVSNLALYEEAESMNRRALVGREKVLGVEHPNTLTSVNNLARVLRGQGKYEEAESMNRRALVGMEKVLGVEHPDTLGSVSNLALVLRGQGKYEEAESMNRRALAGSEKVLGVEHPDTLTSVYCLAYLLSARKSFLQDALDLYQRAVSGYDRVLGVHHPTTAACQAPQVRPRATLQNYIMMYNMYCIRIVPKQQLQPTAGRILVSHFSPLPPALQPVSRPPYYIILKMSSPPARSTYLDPSLRLKEG